MEFFSDNFKLTGAEGLEGFTLEGETNTETTDGSDETTDQKADKGGFNWGFTIIIVALFVMIVAWFLLSGRKNKAGEKEYSESIEAIRPGNKVTSRGGICGVVVEVCDDNTVIIETGSETSGKSRFKLMKECIYETDAKGPTQIAREEAELRRKQEKEAKLAAKEAAKRSAAPAEPSEEPKTEAPAETENAETSAPAENAETSAPAENKE